MNLALAVAIACTLAGGPPPADEPNPEAVREQARALAESGRYEEALQGQIWFHENALRFRPSLVGVRTSFALSDWVELGEKYPPARQALVETRDRARLACIGPEGTVEQFRDVAAINRYLADDADTVATFRTLDAVRPELATKARRAAEQALVAAGEYRLYAKYLPEPDAEFDTIRAEHDRLLAGAPHPATRKSAATLFADRTARLVGTLVATDRRPAAAAIRARALAVPDVPDLPAALDAAERRGEAARDAAR